MFSYNLKTEEQYIVSVAIQKHPARIKKKQQETQKVADLFFVLADSLFVSITREP